MSTAAGYRIGTVMSFEQGKFGFIVTEPGQTRGIFFNWREVKTPGLSRGDRVTFLLREDRDGRPVAREVRRVDQTTEPSAPTPWLRKLEDLTLTKEDGT